MAGDGGLRGFVRGDFMSAPHAARLIVDERGNPKKFSKSQALYIQRLAPNHFRVSVSAIAGRKGFYSIRVTFDPDVSS